MTAVSQKIHSSDQMNAVGQRYFEAGEDALRWIDLALRAGRGGSIPRTILDYACGYGRVLRHLCVAYPEAAITAADTSADMADFNRAAFGVEALGVEDNPDLLDLGKFDLIWVGSLLSHTDESWWLRFLALFHRCLTPDGVLVFTTHGRTVVERALRPRLQMIRYTEEQLEQVLSSYDATGFGYWPTIAPHHGDCVASPAWIADHLPGLRIVDFREGAWLGQDVIACMLD